MGGGGGGGGGEGDERGRAMRERPAPNMLCGHWVHNVVGGRCSHDNRTGVKVLCHWCARPYHKFGNPQGIENVGKYRWVSFGARLGNPLKGGGGDPWQPGYLRLSRATSSR